jgi:hypothetical protein
VSIDRPPARRPAVIALERHRAQSQASAIPEEIEQEPTTPTTLFEYKILDKFDKLREEVIGVRLDLAELSTSHNGALTASRMTHTLISGLRDSHAELKNDFSWLKPELTSMKSALERNNELMATRKTEQALIERDAGGQSKDLVELRALIVATNEKSDERLDKLETSGAITKALQLDGDRRQKVWFSILGVGLVVLEIVLRVLHL